MPSDYIFLGEVLSLPLEGSGEQLFLICILCQLSLELSVSLPGEPIHILLANLAVMLSSL